MNELDEAIMIANRVLDMVNEDPGDDIAILARQLLLALDRIVNLSAGEVNKIGNSEPKKERDYGITARHRGGCAAGWD